MSRKHQELERGGCSGKAVWDVGSSLYDSYELAAVRQLLDRRLLAVAGVLPLTDAPSPPAAETRDKDKQRQVVVVRARRKVTLRALFRAVASWAVRPGHEQSSCACVGVAHDRSSAVEPS